MAIRKTEGIILSSADWSESSQMLTVFTPDLGKISLTVRGGRKLNGKRGRPIRFSRLEFSCYIREGRDNGYLSDVEPVEVFMFERDGQLGRLTFASATLELLNSLLSTLDPQPVCYQITLSFLRMVDTIEKKSLPGLFGGYILRLVSLLGYRPNLTGCVICGKAIEAPQSVEPGQTPILCSIKRGGVICVDCRSSVIDENHMIGLDINIYRKITRLMVSSLEEASQIIVSIKELNQLIDMITSLLKYHAGTTRRIKSFDFLDKLTRAVKTYGG